MSTGCAMQPYKDVFAQPNADCLAAVLRCQERSDQNVSDFFDLLDGVSVLTRGLLHWVAQYAAQVVAAGTPQQEACYIWLALIRARATKLGPAEANFLCVTPPPQPRKDLTRMLKLNTEKLALKVKLRGRDEFLSQFGECHAPCLHHCIQSVAPYCI
jgi:hypothetical protein